MSRRKTIAYEQKNRRRLEHLLDVPVTEKRVSVTRSWTDETDFDKPYVGARDRRAFLESLKAQDWVLRRMAHPSRYTVEHMRVLRRSIQENKPFLAGFFRDEPSWKARLLRLAEMVIRKWESAHPVTR